MDINLSKTQFMFVSCKRVKLTDKMLIDWANVEFVKEFKLLGIIIDSNLNFQSFCAALKKAVSTRLYSIKRLFYLCTAVKLQFFKSFIRLSFCSYFFYSILKFSSSCYSISSKSRSVFLIYLYCLSFSLLMFLTEPSKS